MKMLKRISHAGIYIFILIFLSVQLLCSSVSLEKELTLTFSEKVALDKFKNVVAANLTEDYMKKDIYLIKWLRARSLDIPESTKMLMNNLKWRKENGIDNILNEDFSYFEKRFPYWLDGRDYSDRPVATVDVAVWDPRPVILSGKGDGLVRFVVSILESSARMVREDQANGRNVTQFTLIYNLDGFNLIQHGCLRCVPIYIRFLVLYETYFPGMLHKFFFINTPSTFEVLLQVALPVLHPDTRAALEIYGTNKEQWKRAILESVPQDQIRRQFGGTMDEFDSDNF